MTDERTIRVGFLIYDGIQALDLFGPQEVFVEASRKRSRKAVKYETILISEFGSSVITESGVEIGAQASTQNCPSLHTLIIPGGAGSRSAEISQSLIDWVSAQSSTVERIGSVCTGLFILARAGVLKDHPVTTHWHFADEAIAAFPDLKVVEDALYIRSGPVITSAGVTAGIDMALALVEEDMGTDIASQVARELVVFLRRPGGQNQYSTLLQRQSVQNDKFSDLLVWIADNLTEDLSTEALAARVCLSDRHFRRAFKNIHGEAPARAVERIRIEVAKDWLRVGRGSIEAISRDIGFQSSDSFRRAFERIVGTTPRDYRQRFGN